jgi:hypothetical protein
LNTSSSFTNFPTQERRNSFSRKHRNEGLGCPKSIRRMVLTAPRYFEPQRYCREMFCHYNSSGMSPTSSKKAASLAIVWLPTRPNPQPVESQGFILGVPQPFRDLLCLECAIPRVQFMIEQLGNFFDRARFPDFVQSSRDVPVERASRI